MSTIGTQTYPNLVAGDYPRVTDEVTLATGNLSAGAILGKKTVGAATAAADAGNTGDGAISAVTTGVSTIVGAYVVTCTAAASDAGTFKVVDPNGNQLTESVTVGEAYSNGHLGFTISDGDTDFIVGDEFTITVAAGDGKVILLDKTAKDGTAVPYGVLTADTDASSTEQVCLAYLSGEFNQDSISLADGTTAANVKDACRAKNIYLKEPVSA